MKKQVIFLSIIFLTLFAPTMSVSAQDPILLIIQKGIVKVIKAVDLKIQRLQNKTIWLQNAQKVLENAMSKLKLDQITTWVEKQRTLYQDYFQELWKVKDLVAYYHRVREITDKGKALVGEYHRAWNGVRADHHFTPEEIIYIGEVYTGIIEESLKNLEQVSVVIQSFTTQMSDQKRMQLINAAAEAVERSYSDLKEFNTENIKLSLQRSKDEHDIAVVKKLYGIQ